MSFKPKGANVPAKAKRSNTEFKQYPRSRLAIVDEYDLSSRTIFVTQIAPGTPDDGRKFCLTISPKTASYQNKISQSVKYMGNSIDEKMESYIPVGSRVALEATRVNRRVKKDGEDISYGTTDWVRAVPSQEPHKSFQAWFSVSSFDDRVHGVQVVTPEYAQAIRPDTPEGEKAFIEFSEKLDELAQAYHDGEYVNSYGVAFRTLVKTGEKEVNGEKKNVYQMVDSSPPFDWESQEKDAEGNVIKKGSPLTGKFIEENLNGYLDYAFGTEDGEEPGLIGEGVIKDDQEPIVEMIIYKTYAASSLSPHFSIENEKTPLHQLATVMTKYAINDDTGYIGKNWAVNGVVILSDDKAPEKRGDEWTVRNIVRNLLIDGPKVNLHAVYPAFDGGIVEVHPELDRVIEKTQKMDKKHSRDDEEMPTLSAPPNDDNLFDEEDDDFFNQAIQGSEESFEENEPEPEQPAKTTKRRFNRK